MQRIMVLEFAQKSRHLILAITKAIADFYAKPPVGSSNWESWYTPRPWEAKALVNQVRAAGSEAVAVETVAALVKELRSNSKLLGKEFANWVELNWQKLLDNPKLRRYAPEAKAPVATGAAGAAQTPSQVARQSGETAQGHQTESAGPKKDTYVVYKDGVPIGARKGVAKPGLPAEVRRAEGWPDLPAEQRRNFNSAEPVTLKPGTKIYRIVDERARPDGGYWSDTLPASRAQWRGDSAVKNDWNTNGKYVEYTVPEGPGLKVWQGETAAQRIQGSGYYLPGGGNQIWMPPGSLKPGAAMPTGW